MPSQLNLTDNQVTELLTYHRIKRRSQNVCKDCLEQSQVKEKECFVCARKFTEKHGVIHDGGALDNEFLGTMKSWNDALQGRSGKPENDEQMAEMQRKFIAEAKARGVKIIE